MAIRVIYIGLGSNEGDRITYLSLAVQSIDEKIGKVLRQSSIYETEPWGFEAPQHFLNQVIEVNSKLSTRKLVEALLQIEKELGRNRDLAPKETSYSSRIIDLDLLVDGEIMYNLPELTVPHARLAERKFVLVPLAELSPNLVPPGMQGQNIAQLLNNCQDTSQIRILS